MPHQLLRQQPGADEFDALGPYDPDFRPEYSSLFKATAVIVVLAYGLSLAAALVSRSRRNSSAQTARRKEQQQHRNHRHREAQEQQQQQQQQQQPRQRLRFSEQAQEQQQPRTAFAFPDSSPIHPAAAAAAAAVYHMPRDRLTDMSADRPFRKQQQSLFTQQQHQQQQQQQQQQQPYANHHQQQQPQDRPFRFRANDAGGLHAQHNGWAGQQLPQAPPMPQQQHQEQDCATPPPPLRRQGRQLEGDGSDTPLAKQEPPGSSWDPELLARCAAASPFIASVEGLQQSPAFRSHISKVRGRRLNYETAESHKLRVYKALRDVDPAGFCLLFSRRDVPEYDEVAPSRLLSTLDCLTSSALSLALLGAPWLLPALAPHRAAAALAWLALHLLLAAAGCSSLPCWLASVHATHGPFCQLASWPRLLAGMLLEAALVVCTAGLGVLVSLGCRLLGPARQSAGERLTGVVPLQAVVRPMRFSPLPPARSAAVRGSFGVAAFSDDDDDDDDLR